MKVVARALVDYPPGKGPCSSPGEQLVEVEVEASDRDQAIEACRAMGVGYVMPVTPRPEGARARPHGDKT